MTSVVPDVLERYRALFDAAPSALIVTDPHLTIVEANPAASDLLEVDIRFLPGKPLAAFFETRARRELRTWWTRIVAGEADRSANLRMHRRSGVPFDARVTVSSGRGELYWTVVDRTEEAQAEVRLWELNRELEERVAEQSAELEALADELPVGVAVLSASGDVVWMNSAASALLGGRMLADTPVAAEGARALLGDTVRDMRVEIEAPGRAPRAVRVTAAPVTSHRGGVVLVLDDVSERARIERADAEFVENAAHQLRTPITAIASSVAALEAGAKDDPVERNRFIAHVARESARMGRLVESLLTLATLQRGNGGRPIVELVPVRGLIDDALATVELRDGVRAVVTCSDRLAVVGDGELLAEALRNVIANAAEHTASGEIRIHAEEEEEEEEEHHGNVTLVVADTGPGISVEERDRIFDRFYRGGAKGGRRGSGIGLAIALEAARATRSQLELLEQTDGGGAAFRFTMPGARLL